MREEGRRGKRKRHPCPKEEGKKQGSTRSIVLRVVRVLPHRHHQARLATFVKEGEKGGGGRSFNTRGRRRWDQFFL